MTLCLCAMFCARDLPFITLQMPYNINAFGRQNIVTATDEVSSEAANWLREQGIKVVPIEFHQHWSESLNQMLDQAVALGFDRVIRLDPDEMIFCENVPQINRLLDQYSLLIFPRYNYFWSRTTVNTSAWPDLQYRAWRLDGRSRYVGQRHEGIIFTGPADEVGIVDNIAWHHYGDCSKTAVYERALEVHQLRENGCRAAASGPDS
jgi:hypothetical protein